MHAQQGLEHTVTLNKRFCHVNNKPHTPLKKLYLPGGPDMSIGHKHIIYATK